ncbi:RHS repeat domain-containing protein [Maridesulfovibrio sp.]|uniref:RHS repeat domain-containing protein n=1 Tax=Maridesulfovibrio sp. TaxID=2795000 RepID=UPI0039EF49BD
MAGEFVVKKKDWKDLTSGQRMYGETEPPEKQIETQWEIVECSTGEKLFEPVMDRYGFSKGDILYPTMRKPEVQARWDQKQHEYEVAKDQYDRIKRMCHAQFIRENSDHPLAQGLSETEYGMEVLAEFDKVCEVTTRQHQQKQSQRPYAQTGTGESIHDELAKDGIEIDPDEKIRTITFNVPGVDNPYAMLATACDDKWRIVERLLAFDPDAFHLQYGYDEGGRLNRVWQDDRLIESYEYGKQGERLVAETLHSERRHYEYDDKLRLIKAGDITYTYNAYGSLAEKKVKNRITKYEYLSNGQLCKVVLTDGRIIEYICDKRGVRSAKKINGKIVEKYKWKNFSTLEAITDSKGKNIWTFNHDEEASQIVAVFEGKTYYLARDQSVSRLSVRSGMNLLNGKMSGNWKLSRSRCFLRLFCPECLFQMLNGRKFTEQKSIELKDIMLHVGVLEVALLKQKKHVCEEKICSGGLKHM